MRERDGWAAKDFAKANDISPQYLHDIEMAGRKLSRNVGLIRKFAMTLHIPISMLLQSPEDEAA